ncbi:hypothetical protein [Tepidimonas sp.]
MLPKLGSKHALISKGLRHIPQTNVCGNYQFQTCPDFKGIKTVRVSSP